MKSRILNFTFSIAITLFSKTLCSAQSISPSSVNNGGVSLSQANGSLSFTVGELVVVGFTDVQGNSLGSGFTSGATLTTVSLKECDTSLFNVQVYPNPTQAIVFIQIDCSYLEDFFLTITNLEGKVIKYTQYNKQEKLIAINTSDFTPGTYLLNFKDKNHELLSLYKIIKQ
ncbi:MAG: T9SS C-terminal target domain-containing protein [Flavobacteriia bacterium]|nr:T9SS C-terminal target domain-containing protein [Flavobacteriia bacterium]